MVRIGVDIGSVSVNLVVVDEKGKVIEDRYVRHMGKPMQKAGELLEEVQTAYGSQIDFVATTGTGAKMLAPLVGASFTNEIIALTKAFHTLYPHVGSVIDIGGEDSKFIIFERDGSERHAENKRFFDEHAVRGGHRVVPRPAGIPAWFHHRGVRRGCSQVEKHTPDCRAVHGFCEIGHDPSAADRDARLRARGGSLLCPGAQLQEQHRQGKGGQERRSPS